MSLRIKYPTPRPPCAILRHLYDSLSPIEASFVTQIILKDLRPFLYPLPIFHGTTVPTGYSPPSCKPLHIEDAMRAWDLSGWLLKTYRLKSIVDDATIFFEAASAQQEYTPRVGTCIEVLLYLSLRYGITLLLRSPSRKKAGDAPMLSLT